ncbi:MAG TPA: HAMP domain-containing sensor histidine kinase [Kofleriaceae bacterium]|nr:HAMP domain-containing sensor histidine kinase [Kofleriaceae bacterium]
MRDHREEIIARCRARVAERMVPRPTPLELERGIPLFLRELERTLASTLRQSPEAPTAAVQHGEDLLRSGFTIAQVVHDYGDACQSITGLAIERNAPITTEEFRALNNCLDSAIAEAVTAYAHRRELDAVAEVVGDANQHLGLIAQELRSLLTSATLAFEALRTGSVGIQGSTGDMLEHTLIALSDRVDRSLTEVRLTSGFARQEHIAVGRFLEDIEVSAVLGAHARKLRLTVTHVDPELAVESDRQILSSVISNLLQSAFKHTRPHSHVWLRVRATSDRVLFEIEDQCGGIPPSKCDQLLEQYAQQSNDRTGLGLCIRGTKLLGGAIRVCNRNHGCMFTVDLPRSPS